VFLRQTGGDARLELGRTLDPTAQSVTGNRRRGYRFVCLHRLHERGLVGGRR